MRGVRGVQARVPDGRGHAGRLARARERDRVHSVHGVREGVPEGRAVGSIPPSPSN